jgi:hypothetical protein
MPAKVRMRGTFPSRSIASSSRMTSQLDKLWKKIKVSSTFDDSDGTALVGLQLTHVPTVSKQMKHLSIRVQASIDWHAPTNACLFRLGISLGGEADARHGMPAKSFRTWTPFWSSHACSPTSLTFPGGSCTLWVDMRAMLIRYRQLEAKSEEDSGTHVRRRIEGIPITLICLSFG